MKGSLNALNRFSKFKTFYLRNLNIKPEESLLFTLMFFHSFFLTGVFISIYFVPANGLFVYHYGSSKLPIAYMIAGLMGYLTTMIYSHIQSKVNSRKLFMGALAFMAILPLLTRWSLYFVNEKYVSFFGYIWAWPFISLVAIENGGLALKLLNLRQMKRLFGPIGIGGILASILSYFAIPLLNKVLSHPYDLFYFAVFGVLVSMWILRYLYKKFPERPTEEMTEEVKNQASFKSLIKQKYFVLIFVSAIFSMVALYFTDFGYLSTIKAQKSRLPTADSVSNFIAIVCGVFKIGELLLSYFSSRILTQHGLKLGLTILPTTLTIVIASATFFGLISGVESLIFFAFIVVNKSSERIFRRGLDDPSFNILYQPLPEELKLAVQTKVGVMMQISIGIAGVLLLFVRWILTGETKFYLEYYGLLFLPILFIWSYISRELYKSYRNRLKQILEEKNLKKDLNMSTNIYGLELLTNQLSNSNISAVRLAATIISETNPLALESNAELLLAKDDKTIQKTVLSSLDPTWNRELSSLVNQIKTDNSTQLRKLVEHANLCFDYANIPTGGVIKPNDISNQLQSWEYESRLKVVKMIRNAEDFNDAHILEKLLECPDKDIQQASIKFASKVISPQLKKKLVQMLKNEDLYHETSYVLVGLGDQVLPEIENLMKEKLPEHVILEIIELLARIGTPSSQEILLNQLLNYPNKEIQIAAIKGLYFSEYQAGDKEKQIVKKKIEEYVEYILWLMVCINDIETEKNTLKLIQSLDIDRESSLDVLFALMSFLYQPATIDLIRQNIIGENTIFALEIIENFINQDIKQLIIPIFDNIPIGQRIKKLQEFCEIKRLKFDDRLKEIVSRDYNKSDVWTIAKTLELMGRLHKKNKTEELENGIEHMTENIELWTNEKFLEILANVRKSEMPDEVFVCLYHPDEIVYSTAAKIIYDENPRRWLDYIKRLPKNKHNLIDILQNEESETSLLLADKVKALKKFTIFYSVPENLLIKLAKIITAKFMKKGEIIDYTLPEYQDTIILVIKGVLYYDNHKDEEIQLSKNDVILRGLNIEVNADFVHVRKDSLLLLANRYQYFNLLMDEKEILNHMFGMLELK